MMDCQVILASKDIGTAENSATYAASIARRASSFFVLFEWISENHAMTEINKYVCRMKCRIN